MTIKGLHNKVQQLNTDTIIESAFESTKYEFEKANIEQLKAGRTNKGDKIQPGYRNAAYARKKNQLNPLPGFGTPDLILTGDFTGQLNIIIEGNTIKEFSNDAKGPELENKYADIFGLGSDYKKQYLSESLRPALNKEITAVTGLKFT